VLQSSARCVVRGARLREKRQLVNRKSERANIGIEEADNGGEIGERSERDKMEFGG
jgi:hypothetical protein